MSPNHHPYLAPSPPLPHPYITTPTASNTYYVSVMHDTYNRGVPQYMRELTSTNYSLLVYSSSCMYYNTRQIQDQWAVDKCRVHDHNDNYNYDYNAVPCRFL